MNHLDLFDCTGLRIFRLCWYCRVNTIYILLSLHTEQWNERERRRDLKLLLGDLTSVLHSTITLLPTCVQAVYKANGSETTLSLSGYCSQGYFFKELERSQDKLRWSSPSNNRQPTKLPQWLVWGLWKYKARFRWLFLNISWISGDEDLVTAEEKKLNFFHLVLRS